MTVKQLAEKLDLRVCAGLDGMDHEVNGCYIGDLLSWVMAKAQKDNVWITIMSNVNVVAVCSLTDAACVILCEGVTPDEDCAKRADIQDVPILLSDKTAYELALQVSKALV